MKNKDLEKIGQCSKYSCKYCPAHKIAKKYIKIYNLFDKYCNTMFIIDMKSFSDDVIPINEKNEHETTCVNIYKWCSKILKIKIINEIIK